MGRSAGRRLDRHCGTLKKRAAAQTAEEDVMARWWKFFLAWTRLSSEAVCEMSASRGLNDDFHRWADSTVVEPGNGYTHTCKRCGKPFVT